MKDRKTVGNVALRGWSGQIQGGPKNWHRCFVRLNFTILTDFQNHFTVRNRTKFVIIGLLSLKIPPHIKCVVTEWVKVSQRFIDRAPLVSSVRRRLECVVQQQADTMNM